MPRGFFLCCNNHKAYLAIQVSNTLNIRHSPVIVLLVKVLVNCRCCCCFSSLQIKLWMMKGQIHEELDQLDNARESYKLGVCL